MRIPTVRQGHSGSHKPTGKLVNVTPEGGKARADKFKEARNISENGIEPAENALIPFQMFFKILINLSPPKKINEEAKEPTTRRTTQRQMKLCQKSVKMVNQKPTPDMTFFRNFSRLKSQQLAAGNQHREQELFHYSPPVQSSGSVNGGLVSYG